MKDLVYTCEIKRVQSKKTPSLDLEYEAVLRTSDPGLLELGLIGADTLVQVTFMPLAEQEGRAGLPRLQNGTRS